MVLGEVLEPKPGPREAPRGPKTAKNQKGQNPGNHILRVSMGRSVKIDKLPKVPDLNAASRGSGE